MHPHCRNAVAAHSRLYRFKQSRTDALVLFRCLYIQPMNKRFIRSFDPRIPAAADHPVVIIRRDPKHIPTVKVILFDIEQIFVDTRYSSKRVLACKTMKIISPLYLTSYNLISMLSFFLLHIGKPDISPTVLTKPPEIHIARDSKHTVSTRFSLVR